MTHSAVAINVASMSYRDGGEVVIRDLRLLVPDGRFVSLLGRSGAGKTTLLRIVAGLEQRFAGEVSIGDMLVRRPGKSIQLVFQDGRLLPWKTVFENVAFATDDPKGIRSRPEVEAWLSRVGLLRKAGEWPKNLSGGETARATLARALITQPRVLLLDEPFQSLDLITRFEVQDALVKDLQMNRPTVILVSHSIEDAVFLSDEIHVLSHRPMSVLKTFSVPFPRPRSRGQQELAQLTAEITDYLSSSIAGHEAAPGQLGQA